MSIISISCISILCVCPYHCHYPRYNIVIITIIIIIVTLTIIINIKVNIMKTLAVRRPPGLLLEATVVSRPASARRPRRPDTIIYIIHTLYLSLSLYIYTHISLSLSICTYIYIYSYLYYNRYSIDSTTRRITYTIHVLQQCTIIYYALL